MKQSLSWEVKRSSASQEIPRNISFIIALTKARQLSLSRARQIQYVPISHLLEINFNITFASTTWSSPQVSPPKPCMHFSCHQHVLHVPPIFFIILSPEPLVRSTEHKATHYVFFSTPVTLSHLGPNILFNTLTSNTLNLCSSLDVTDQVSHPYKTTSKIIVPYILNFIFLDSKMKTNDSAPNDSKQRTTGNIMWRSETACCRVFYYFSKNTVQLILTKCW